MFGINPPVTVYIYIYIYMSQCKHLDFLLVLEPAFADDDVLDASPVSELLLEHGVEFEKFLRLLLRDSVQGIFINHPHSLKL